MKIKEGKSQILFQSINVVIMVLMMILMLYPLLYVAFVSLSNPAEIMYYRGVLLKPLGLDFSAYAAVFKNHMIGRGYLNTFFIVTVGVTVNIIMTAFGAYFLSRKGLILQKAVMFMVVFTMFFSGGLIPFYFTVKSLGIYNTLWALILPVSINTFNLIIMRTSFAAIPDSMEESAKLDGAGHFTILFRIIFPLSKAVIAVMVLYYAVGHWNSWFNAMIFINKRELYPLQLILREILIDSNTNDMLGGVATGDHESVGETIKYAVIIVSTLPILCVYPFLQKYFVKGVLIGAVKG